MWKKVLQIAFWALVAVTTLPLILMFFKPPLPDVGSSPEEAKSFDEKMARLSEASPGSGEVRISERELNSKVQQSLGDLAAAGGPVALKNLTVHLAGNQVEGVFRVETMGLSLYLVMGATVSVDRHRLVFEPTILKLGRLPVPVSMVAAELRDRLNGAEMRSLFELPENVREVRIVNGEMVFEKH